jgi:hypothetical protein
MADEVDSLLASAERLVMEASRNSFSGGRKVACGMLIDWLRSSPRTPPELAFTAGPERELADEIEMAIQKAKSNA